MLSGGRRNIVRILISPVLILKNLIDLVQLLLLIVLVEFLFKFTSNNGFQLFS